RSNPPSWLGTPGPSVCSPIPMMCWFRPAMTQRCVYGDTKPILSASQPSCRIARVYCPVDKQIRERLRKLCTKVPSPPNINWLELDSDCLGERVRVRG